MFVAAMRHEFQSALKSSGLEDHFQRYVSSACTLLQARGSLRDTDELRYLILTWWPSFRKMAEVLTLSDFVYFLRNALGHPKLFLADVRKICLYVV